MSFGLSRKRDLDTSGVLLDHREFPPLPDDVLTNPISGYLDIAAWFRAPAHPLEIEIGSGKGSFLLDHAAANPGVNLLGIEYAGEFCRYAADRVRRRGLTNVKMLCVDAVEFVRWRVRSASVANLHLYFSDPWPKAKHHKNRVVQDRFLTDAWRVLMPGGELRIVTDHDELWAWNEAHFARACAGAPDSSGSGVPPVGERPSACFERLPFTPPTWADEGATVGTNYERKMCEAVGKQPHACVLRKC
ncbi:hypothetical protein BH11PLA1_BH11PLA1_02260 [soil metagenome]